MSEEESLKNFFRNSIGVHNHCLAETTGSAQEVMPHGWSHAVGVAHRPKMASAPDEKKRKQWKKKSSWLPLTTKSQVARKERVQRDNNFIEALDDHAKEVSLAGLNTITKNLEINGEEIESVFLKRETKLGRAQELIKI